MRQSISLSLCSVGDTDLTGIHALYEKTNTMSPFFLIDLALVIGFVHCDRQQYFEDMIKSRTDHALNYKFQEDAKMYEATDKATVTDFGIYDFIVIGAGASGSVIANRISEIKDWEILLLEAGDDPDDFVMIPRYFAVNVLTDYNWGYQTTPQKNACLGNINQKCRLPTGKGTGGTTLISELVYSRGDPQMYDKWAKLVKDPSWAFKNVLPYLKKSENYTGNVEDGFIDEGYHGFDGYWQVSNFEKFYPLSEIFLAGNVDMGVKFTDYNGKEQIGSAILQINTKNGRRCDQYSAFIKPIMNERDNLKISKQSYVIKIEFNSTRYATAVLFTKNMKIYRARVNHEVILSAGVIGSPQLLMLSGIGPKDHLKQHGIEVLENLEVGSTFRDHLMTQVFFSSNLSSSVNHSQTDQIKEYLTGHGILTAANPIDVIGAYNTFSGKESQTYPNLQLSISQGGISEMTKKLLNWNNEIFQELYGQTVKNAFTLVALLLHSHSTGSIRLKSSSPYEYPLIDGNYLSDPKGLDIETLYQGIQIALRLIKTPAFQSINATLAVPHIPACQRMKYLSKDFWYCYIRQAVKSAFHPVGSCLMGATTNSVVNSQFKVGKMRHIIMV
ncbi:unnamed protein product [Acanthoscelides obtectus]|uniref:Glucose dehydrogenase [FAD, quinone]-like n=1 Tax=Acanthoscelides obtectus TaxID=200917 RepID=A0A9P0JWH4_ACAOB|nr:unnamed protein product [Acanthoscelides obtectus]CAK1663671.1 Glucose dehydrogenase [FAD, quinone] [Acanthoscelides obtectus]